MKIESFINQLNNRGYGDFFTGVPDSQLKALCDFLYTKYGIDSKRHIVAANEGNCVAIAAGYHLSTGKVPVVYMQNSGEGNIINPVASLLNKEVYGIPMIFIIGWRGEPGVHDEPQHIYQGKVTLKLLDDMDISHFVISPDTTEAEIAGALDEFEAALKDGRQVAFVVKKKALTFDGKAVYENDNEMVREEIIEHIVKFTEDDPIVSTTGKASRELFEIRERGSGGIDDSSHTETNGDENESAGVHSRDFLTVGSMGHGSSIALGIAINKPEKRIWCIDGDGAALMHMGAMAVIGAHNPKNLVHIVINNGAHETVGGMPTVAGNADLCAIAKACGYKNIICASTYEELDEALDFVVNTDGLAFIEAKCKIGSRPDLGRPTTTAMENKINFMESLKD